MCCAARTCSPARRARSRSTRPWSSSASRGGPEFGHRRSSWVRAREALRARPRVAPGPLPGRGLPARGPAQLPGPAGLGDRRDRDVFMVAEMVEAFDIGDVNPEPGALRPQEGRGDQRRPHADAVDRGPHAPGRPVPEGRGRADLPRERPDASLLEPPMPSSPSGSTSSPRPHRCSASCSPTSRSRSDAGRRPARRRPRGPSCPEACPPGRPRASRPCCARRWSSSGIKPKPPSARSGSPSPAVDSPPLFESLELLDASAAWSGWPGRPDEQPVRRPAAATAHEQPFGARRSPARRRTTRRRRAAPLRPGRSRPPGSAHGPAGASGRWRPALGLFTLLVLVSIAAPVLLIAGLLVYFAARGSDDLQQSLREPRRHRQRDAVVLAFINLSWAAAIRCALLVLWLFHRLRPGGCPRSRRGCGSAGWPGSASRSSP